MYTPKRIGEAQRSLHLRSETHFKRVLLQLVVENRHLLKDHELLLRLINEEEYSDLLRWSDYASAQMYTEAAQHFAANQIAALIRKYPWTPAQIPGLDPEKTAMEKFYRAEHQCKRVNQRFRATVRNPRCGANSLLLDKARRWIRRILGQKPNLLSIYGQCDFGPGSSIGIHGNATNLGRKILSESWTVTPTALPYALGAIWANAHWRELVLLQDSPIPCLDPEYFREKVKAKCVLVDYNKITMVPKTAKTHRTIAVEPLLNGYLQKGVDQWMRNRLRRLANIDLSNQSVNSLMAFEGSQGGFNPYVTIDLSSASDSISIELVRLLLPPDWFSFLNEIRSPAYKIGDKVTTYQKFVSMGNGFCFPLETLIFASLAIAVGWYYQDRHDFRVYGDDIILRQNLALHLIELLDYCGFKVNPDKTFLFGPFRESCGEDWFDGQAVRPVYVDHRLDSIESIYSLHNATLRNSLSEGFWEGTRQLLRAVVPRDFRFCRYHKGSSDSCFQVPFDVFMHCQHVK